MILGVSQISSALSGKICKLRWTCALKLSNMDNLAHESLAYRLDRRRYSISHRKYVLGALEERHLLSGLPQSVGSRILVLFAIQDNESR